MSKRSCPKWELTSRLGQVGSSMLKLFEMILSRHLCHPINSGLRRHLITTSDAFERAFVKLLIQDILVCKDHVLLRWNLFGVGFCLDLEPNIQVQALNTYIILGFNCARAC